MTEEISKRDPAKSEVAAELVAVDHRMPFGPVFFLTQLKGLVRDCCPDSAEALPHVQLHLHGGEILDLCHVIGLAPVWVALAVYDDPDRSEATKMRTELIPYEAIAHVTIGGKRDAGSHHIGFDSEHDPRILKHTELGGDRSPEEALRVLAQTTPSKEIPHHSEKKP